MDVKYHHGVLYITGFEDSISGFSVHGFQRDISFTFEKKITRLWHRECVTGY